jgi:octaprenyl-diphosphate synthase
VTLPLIYALSQATPEESKLVETVLADGNYEQVPFLKIMHFIRKYRGIELAMEKAQSFTDRARAIMNEFPDSRYQRALISVTGLVTERDH